MYEDLWRAQNLYCWGQIDLFFNGIYTSDTCVLQVHTFTCFIQRFSFIIEVMANWRSIENTSQGYCGQFLSWPKLLALISRCCNKSKTTCRHSDISNTCKYPRSQGVVQRLQIKQFPFFGPLEQSWMPRGHDRSDQSRAVKALKPSIHLKCLQVGTEQQQALNSGSRKSVIQKADLAIGLLSCSAAAVERNWAHPSQAVLEPCSTNHLWKLKASVNARNKKKK